MPDREPASQKSALADATREVGAGAPDPAKCRAGRTSHGLDLPLCFVKPTPHCQFGGHFAGVFLCRHPQVERIIARTRAHK